MEDSPLVLKEMLQEYSEGNECRFSTNIMINCKYLNFIINLILLI